MKEQIRQRAIELGFDDCRFTRADAPAGAKEFQKWVAEKKYGEMAWIEKNAEKRVEPQKVLQHAKTTICLAASYFLKDSDIEASNQSGHSAFQATGEQFPLSQRERAGVRENRSNENPGEARAIKGIVARYARFNDYHDILGERLKSLTQYVAEVGGVDTRSLLVCGHGTDSRARFCSARRHRLCRQAYQLNQPQVRQLDFSRGDFNDARIRTRRT